MGFVNCWERVKQATRLRKQTELADFLNISSSNISEAKVKDRFPLHWAFKIGQEFKICTDWIMTGQESQDTEPGGIKRQKSESEEDRVYHSLDYILQQGNTYQRGVVKGYLNELADEITERVKKAKKQ